MAFAEPLDEKLAKINREAEERAARRVAQQAKLPYLNLGTAPIQVDALGLLSDEEAHRLYVAPFQFKNKVIALAVLDPSNDATVKLIRRLEDEGNKVNVFVVSLSGLKHAWSHYRFAVKPMEDVSGKVELNPERFKKLYQKLGTLQKTREAIEAFDFKKMPTTTLIEIVMAGALRSRASDIHFEAEEKGVRLRYRIDGTLQDVLKQFSDRLYPFLVSRIKLLSGLKLNVKDTPQDGRFTVALEEKEIEMRVSIIPSEFGETIVMRVLNPDSLKTDLTELGLRPDDLAIIETELNRPNGMILNTGPTGSGKTTTLYTFLLHKRSPEIKIITIEDPVEYHLKNVEQTQIDSGAGYTFVSGLRSIMRQDPDIILVGEIRDKETAEIAIQAALTGHLVFSTVHANSSAGAIPRLLDLNVKAVSIGPALNLVIAQRLVRVLCSECKREKKIDAETKKNIQTFLKKIPARIARDPYEAPKLYEAKGCAQCNNVGYRGRIALFELLQISSEIQEMITENVSPGQIQEIATKNGMATMQADGILKALVGVTTLQEVESVTGPLKW